MMGLARGGIAASRRRLSALLLFEDDFTTLSLRNAVDTGRKNQIRNSALWGAKVGSMVQSYGPGTDNPENWYYWSGQNLSLSITALGTATVDGVLVRTATFRVQGTAAGGGEFWLHPEFEGALRTSAGQPWTFSAYVVASASGSSTNVTWAEIRTDARTDAAVTTGAVGTGIFPLPGTMTRYSASFTTTTGANHARAAFVVYHNAGAIDFYFTVAAPQMENAATVSALDYRTPDGSGTWNTDYFNSQTPGGGEEQYYVHIAQDGTRLSGGNNPFSVSNSILSITGAAAPGGTSASRAYTSGILTTRGGFDFKHGYVEARIKMPAGGGWWPALWGLPVSNAYAVGKPEIDFMEWWANDPATLQGNLHSYATGSHTVQWSYQTVSDLSAGFNLFGCEWRADRVIWYFNRVAFSGDTVPAGFIEPPADVEATNLHLLLNLAMGGGGHGVFTNTGQLPGAMQVDYVRVWDKRPF